MKKLVAVVAATGMLTTTAGAQSWSLGSHVSLVSLNSEYSGSGSTTVFGWPANTLAYQPGLRIGIATRTHGHEIVLDSGMLVIDEAGSTLSQLVATLGYQYTYRSAGGLAPFANGVIGYYREGGAAGASSPLTYGAGVGIRHIVGDRHGCVRAEVRIDRLRSDPQFGRPRLTIYGLRLGFDLWSGGADRTQASARDASRQTGASGAKPIPKPDP